MVRKSPVNLNKVFLFLIFYLFFNLTFSDAQLAEELEFSLDFNSSVVDLPKIYRPSVDLSGRGKQQDKTLPQTLAAPDALIAWQTDLGFRNFYRIQYNLWEIQRLAKDQEAYQKLLNNYEEIFKKISDSGGTVILDLFGTPDGLGAVLDKNSAPHNLKIYKELVKNTIRKFSCEKKYNIWYEVWNAPDLGDFFLGGRSEYFNLYRIIGEAVNELRRETKIHIPLGGPSASAWFRNITPNSVLSPEGSLIYELIKFCYSYRLPLDFISWHAYSSDPLEEKQETIYHKSFVKLIREWLTYFKFDSSIPLLVDEWNFDGAANILAERAKLAHISASYIPARLKNMYEAGVDYQTYFCLEDFGDNQSGVIRNLGVFSFDAGRPENKGYAKASYNLWRMFSLFGQDLFTLKFSDEFVGVISTKSADYLTMLVYNYIDPQAAMNYISRNIVNLDSAEQKAILGIVRSDRMKKILAGQLSLATLRLSDKTKILLSRAIELNSLANKFSTLNRKIKISLKGLKDIYVLSKYVIDNNCSRNCEFKPISEKDADFNQSYVETIDLSPYSVQLLVFKKKPNLVLAAENSESSGLPAGMVLPGEAVVETKPVTVLNGASKVLSDQLPGVVLPSEVKLPEKASPKEPSNAEIK